MKFIKIFPIVLLLFWITMKTFADAPEISYGQSTFNFLKGYYILKDNVVVSMNNHGFKGSIRADEAKVSLLNQKCLATGNVTLTHEDITLSCNEAFANFNKKNVIVVGNVDFKAKENLKITSDKATFNWGEKIADFYGKVKLEKNSDSAKIYEHVRYNVETNEILQLDQNFNSLEIVIPDFDN